MSYGFYVYTDRESIATTKVYSQTSGQTYKYDYGTGQQSLSGFTDGNYLSFTAVPADGYEFYRWVYHVGSPSAETQYSTSNPFKYYGSTGNDIYIAAEGQSTSGGGESGGGDTATEWTLTTSNITDPDTTQYVVFDLGKMECRRIRMMFATTGKVTVSVNSGGYHAGYLGTTARFDSETGMPTDHTYSYQGYSGGFNITCTDIDTVYYLWITSIAGGSVSNITVTVVPPDTEEATDYFEWSSAVAQGLPIKNVSHTEWDNFIDKIIEVLTDKGMQSDYITVEKYGYAVGTTYITMLQDCYLTYDSDLEGYPLTAQKFNVARFIIGSHVQTELEESEKTSKSSKVLALDFIKLANRLKAWQG